MDVYGCIWLVVKLLFPELGPITAIPMEPASKSSCVYHTSKSSKSNKVNLFLWQAY